MANTDDGEFRSQNRSGETPRDHNPQRQYRRATTRSSWRRLGNRHSRTRRESQETRGDMSSSEQTTPATAPIHQVADRPLQVTNTMPDSVAISKGGASESNSQRTRRRHSRDRRGKYAQVGQGEQTVEKSRNHRGGIAEKDVSSTTSSEKDVGGDRGSSGTLTTFLHVRERKQVINTFGSITSADASSGASTIPHGNSKTLQSKAQSAGTAERSKSPGPADDPGDQIMAQGEDDEQQMASKHLKASSDDHLGERQSQGAEEVPEYSERSKESVSGTQTSIPSFLSPSPDSSTSWNKSSEFEHDGSRDSQEKETPGRIAKLLRHTASLSSSSLPSLASYSTSDSTEFEVVSNSGSNTTHHLTQDSTAASMPSLASFSSSDDKSGSNPVTPTSQKGSTSFHKVYVIPEEQDGSSPSFTSLTLDLNAKQPTFDLAIMGTSISSISKNGAMDEERQQQGKRQKYRPKLLYEGVSSQDDIDSRASASSHSSLPAQQRTALARNLHVTQSPGSSKRSSRSFISPASPRQSVKSDTSLVGQQLISAPDLDSSQDLRGFYDSGSMVYSETSHGSVTMDDQSAASTTESSVATRESRPASTTLSQESRGSAGTRSTRVPVGAPVSSPASASTKSRSRSQHSHKKPKPAPYDGVLCNWWTLCMVQGVRLKISMILFLLSKHLVTTLSIGVVLPAMPR